MGARTATKKITKEVEKKSSKKWKCYTKKYKLNGKEEQRRNTDKKIQADTEN